jgi:hypothetical protein
MGYCSICHIRESVAEVQGVNQCSECNMIALNKLFDLLGEQRKELKYAVAGLYWNKCDTKVFTEFLESCWNL